MRNQFLIVVRHQSDDVPVQLVSSSVWAQSFIDNMTERDAEQAAKKYADISNIECTTPVCAAYIEFDEKGYPIKSVVGRVFGDN